jgi:hypothetical protein
MLHYIISGDKRKKGKERSNPCVCLLLATILRTVYAFDKSREMFFETEEKKLNLTSRQSGRQADPNQTAACLWPVRWNCWCVGSGELAVVCGQ